VVRTNICGDTEVLFEYFMRWMAHCIQFPHEKPGVAIVLMGVPGCGKGQAFTPIRLINGRHGVITDDLESRFNSLLADAVFLQVQELRKGVQAVNHLKQLVTESRMRIESKGREARESLVSQHVGITTNDDDAVNMQNGERRFAVYPCAKRLPADFAFWAAVDKEVNDVRVLGALLSYWQRLDLKDFQPRAIPPSPAAFTMQYASMSLYERFMYHVLRTGSLFPAGDFDLPDSDKDRPKFLALLDENARVRVRPAILLNEIGLNVFSRADCVPKRLFVEYFSQMYPRQQTEGGAVPLWKLLHDLNGVAKNLFEIKKLRLPNNVRLDVVSFVGGLDVWRRAFLDRRGNLDDSVWDAVGYGN
jgi:hypothetical protein